MNVEVKKSIKKKSLSISPHPNKWLETDFSEAHQLIISALACPSGAHSLLILLFLLKNQ